MNKHLIGPEILSLAEVDVLPEDLVFHKFYMNKMNTSKKPKKKKKKRGAEDEAAEDLLGDDGGDESDNEEIENMLDSSHLSVEANGDFDYDDLDQVADEDDEDLVGNISDAEMDTPSDAAEGEDFDDTADEIDIDDDDVSDIGDDDDDDIIEIGDADYDSNEEEDDRIDQRKRKSRKAGASPFANFEDYEHLLNEDISTENEPSKRPKSQKKRKSDA